MIAAGYFTSAVSHHSRRVHIIRDGRPLCGVRLARTSVAHTLAVRSLEDITCRRCVLAYDHRPDPPQATP